VTSVFEWAFRLFAWFARRPVLKIRIIDDDPEKEAGGLVFEVENASPTPTSLVPTVRSTFWFPQKGQFRKGHAVYDVCDLDRELPPFKAKVLSASARTVPPGYGHAWFRIYEFQPRRGPCARLRIRSAMLEPLGTARFCFELWRFRLSGRVRRPSPVKITEMDAQRRSRGPH
jgi:hypothetical protein